MLAKIILDVKIGYVPVMFISYLAALSPHSILFSCFIAVVYRSIYSLMFSLSINTIKNELPVTFVSLGIIMYLAILDVHQRSCPDFLEYGPPAGPLHT
jgi:hypothetical protein